MKITDIIIGLEERIAINDKSIEDLEQKNAVWREAIQNLKSIAITEKDAIHPLPRTKKVIHAKDELTEKQRVKGVDKFSKYLMEILRTNPEKKYQVYELAEKCEDAFANHRIKRPPKKDFKSQVSTYLYAFYQRGDVIRDKDEKGKYNYQYAERGRKIKRTPKDRKNNQTDYRNYGLLEETILNIFEKHPRVIFDTGSICQKIKYSSEYGLIAKDSNGPLEGNVTTALNKLFNDGRIQKAEENVWIAN